MIVSSSTMKTKGTINDIIELHLNSLTATTDNQVDKKIMMIMIVIEIIVMIITTTTKIDPAIEIRVAITNDMKRIILTPEIIAMIAKLNRKGEKRLIAMTTAAMTDMTIGKVHPLRMIGGAKMKVTTIDETSIPGKKTMAMVIMMTMKI